MRDLPIAAVTIDQHVRGLSATPRPTISSS
jgi:hypothetical protein